MRYVVPAVLTWDEGDGVYYVDFPDTEDYFGCYTYGQDLFEALENAEDALSLMLWGAEEDGLPIPEPSAIGDIDAPAGAIVTLVRADTEAYAAMIERERARTEAAAS